MQRGNNATPEGSARVLMVASEAVPFAKTGGLADVVGSLAPALRQLGCEVRLVMPFYSLLMDAGSFSGPIIRDLPVALGPQLLTAEIYQGELAADVPVYFVSREEFFERRHLYGTSRHEYFDNAQRFVFLSRAALALGRQLEYQAKVVHVHDWQAALIPAYLKNLHADDPFWANTAAVLTIHNIAYQGRFPAEAFPLTGLPGAFFSVDGMEFWGGVNFLKAGIVSADVITTVSPRYAEEICTPEFGHGLEGVLLANRHKLHGILNGADYQRWNPEIDPHIARNYSARDLEGKRECKRDLLATVGLPARLHQRPVLGMVTRLAEQKGLDLLGAVVERLLEKDVGLVILGAGEERFEQMLAGWAKSNPKKVAVRIGFDEVLAHKIEAGADIYLMPSRYEPCGLNQIYSLRYGTIPVVHATGGLYDTVEPFDPGTGTGVGFRFSPFDVEAFWQAIDTALELYARKDIWRRLMLNAMSRDYSWERSARRYLELYQGAHAAKSTRPAR